MPRLHVVAVAPRLPAWARAARAAYLARMPRGYEVSLLELPAREEPRLLARLPAGARIVALDERGRDLTSVEFAALLDRPTAFVIGGPDGLPAAVRRRAELRLRLSSLTLAHALAQVVLVEQLYRAATLRTGHPYHRD
ncbi:MAG: 23S rRNA (pseudouridine(1915)-N(3))-methyltransferase RlmH [Burkholderiales bacterium]|nr:23S rRNA (pseudouridine(1915)-N(3))-methyltransferase RlmH [Burkholderiales bacterium]